MALLLGMCEHIVLAIGCDRALPEEVKLQEQDLHEAGVQTIMKATNKMPNSRNTNSAGD